MFHNHSVRLDHAQVVQLIARLATSVNHLSDALNSSAHEVMLMNIAQANAVRATDGLIGTLQQMNETVMNALVDINATAIRVNQTIGANFYSFYSVLLSLAGAIVLSCEDDHIPLPFVSVPYD
jgi:outer membrane protein TolC